MSKQDAALPAWLETLHRYRVEMTFALWAQLEQQGVETKDAGQFVRLADLRAAWLVQLLAACPPPSDYPGYQREKALRIKAEADCQHLLDTCVPVEELRDAEARIRELEAASPPPSDGWQPISTAPADTVIIGALIRDGKVWRVHEMRHNGLAFYTVTGGSLPQMTHWMPLPTAPPGGETS